MPLVYCFKHKQQYQLLVTDKGVCDCCLDCEIEALNSQVDKAIEFTQQSIDQIKRQRGE